VKEKEKTQSQDMTGEPRVEEAGLGADRSRPEEEKDLLSVSAAGIISKFGERIIALLSKVPLVQKIPLQRIGPKPTAVGTLVLVFILVVTITFVVVNTVPESTNAQALVQEQKKPKPIPAKLILTHDRKTWTINMRKLGYNGKKDDTLDKEALLERLRVIKKQVDEPAVNARMKRWGSPIQPEKEGKLMDMAVIEHKWLDDLDKRLNHPQPIPMVPDQPDVTTEDLKQVNARKIGSYTTYYNPGNANRTTNVRLSSQAINNVVLNPGEVFSFNQTVGQRTSARGYRPAKIIVRGEYSEGIGGGICQTSSTLFNSVDEAGLQVVARFSHSKEVTYVPKGRDATVSWYGPDFRFKNNLTEPILIRSYLSGGALTVEVYSTPKADNHAKAVQPAPRNPEPVKNEQPKKPTDELQSDKEGNE
jgi:vancomycin resistance protein YoaR